MGGGGSDGYGRDVDEGSRSTRSDFTFLQDIYSKVSGASDYQSREYIG